MSTTLVTAVPAKTKTAGYGATTATSALAPFSIPRRDPLPHDVEIDILTAASAIPIYTRRAMNGIHNRFRLCPDTKSLAA